VTVGAEGTNAFATVRAADGATLESGDARLVIPAGALNQDTVVTLRVGAAPIQPAEDPMQPAGPAVTIDLGGARLLRAATLAAPYTPTQGLLYVFTETNALADSANDEADMGAVHVHRATRPVTPPGALSASVLELSVVRAGAFVVNALPAPNAATPNTSLQVPFYWQAGFPWCSPTSTSMYLNYFQPLPGLDSSTEAPGGRVSNYFLASLIHQDITSGSWPASFLQAANVPTDRYAWRAWDADLIPSDEFSAYIVMATTGVLGLFPRKPVLTTSDKNAHAFVITGLSADGITINDSNARWAGTHPAMSWDLFRTQNAIGTSVTELGTLLVFGEPRPEAELRGSLEMAPPTAEDRSRTIRFKNPSGSVVSNWQWDANPFQHGYYFDDATGRNLLPLDSELGRVLPRSSQIEANFNVVNTTNVALDYEVLARLYVNDSFKAEQVATAAKVGAYSRQEVDLSFGNVATVVGALGGTATGRLEINLRQGGAVQDVKTVSFRFGPDPTDTPTVTIRRPTYGIKTFKTVPLAFQGEAYDRLYLGDADGAVPNARMSWWEGNALLANGGATVQLLGTVGQHVLTLKAVGEYGAVGSQTILVNVIDPARNPGEVVIDYPADNATFAYANYFDVNLVGHATYNNGTPVPEDRLSWTVMDGADSRSAGAGSGQVVRLYGHCTGHRYTISFTARVADGSPIGTRSITVNILAPPC
jgi:hypothetical protein